MTSFSIQEFSTQTSDLALGWFKLYSMLPKVFIFTSIVVFPILAHCTAAVQSFFLWRSKLSTLQIKTFRQAYTQIPTSLSKLRFQRNDITI